MYKLYYSPGTASFCVHWMLVELGADFTLEALDFKAGDQRQAAFLALNPKGQTPTLVIDGRAYTESAALLMILAERHPEAGFAPAIGAPDRAEYLELMAYLANVLLPSFRNWYYVDDYATEPHHEDSLAHARVRIEAVWTLLDNRLADGRAHLLGDAFTAPDFLVTMLARWSRNLPRTAESWPHLGAYLARVKQRPGLRETHAREGLTGWLE